MLSIECRGRNTDTESLNWQMSGLSADDRASCELTHISISGTTAPPSTAGSTIRWRRCAATFCRPTCAAKWTVRGVDACVAVQARQTLEETRWLLELADAHPFVAGVVGWIDLQADDVADAAGAICRASEARRRAPHRSGRARRSIHAAPGVLSRHLAARRSRPHLRHPDLSADILPVAAELVSRFRRQRFVLDHLAKPDIRTGEIREWEKGSASSRSPRMVFCKLSGLVTEADWTAGHRTTSGRISMSRSTASARIGCSSALTGRCARWPPITGEPFRSLTITSTSRPAAERDAVMGGNAARFWRLPAGPKLEPKGELV